MAVMARVLCGYFGSVIMASMTPWDITPSLYPGLIVSCALTSCQTQVQALEPQGLGLGLILALGPWGVGMPRGSLSTQGMLTSRHRGVIEALGREVVRRCITPGVTWIFHSEF